MTVAAVVFDLDGVVVDSEPVWEAVRRQFVAEQGGRWLPDTQRRLMGMSTAEWSRYLAEDLGVRMSPEQVADEVVARMEARYSDRLPLITGAIEAVDDLRERWPLGLASSSPRRLIDTVLDRAGLAGAFTFSLSTEEVARGKPAPDVYLAVADRLGSLPAECVAVEDSSNGVRAAVAAGMRTIAIERPEYPLDDDARSAAALRLVTISDLNAGAVARLDSAGVADRSRELS